MNKWLLIRPARPIDLPWQERPTAIVWVESVDYDEDGTLQLECEDEHLREKILYAIDMAYGVRGRSLNSREPFSPRDLACAVTGRWMVQFEAKEL